MSNTFDNNTILSEDQMDKLNYDQTIVMWPVILFMLILFVTGLIGNSLVIAVYTTKHNATASNISMLGLAVVDILSCVIIHPYIVYKLTHQYNQVWVTTCKIFEFFNHASLGVSMGILFAIAFDRYRAICYPHRLGFAFYTFRNLLIFSVVHGIVISLPLLYFYGARTILKKIEHTKFKTYMCDYGDEHQGTTIFKLFSLFVMLGFTCLVISMSILYCKVGATIYRTKRVRPTTITIGVSPQTSTSQTPACSTGTEMSVKAISGMNKFPVPVLNPVQTSTLPSGPSPHKAAKMLFLVTAVFLLSWLPFWIIRITRIVVPNFWMNKSNFGTVVEALFTHLFYLNNAINPFIYAVMNKRFREDLSLLVRKLRRSLT